MDTAQESLHRDAALGSVEGVKSALAAGADVNHCDEDGDTALLKAVRNGHVNCVKFLVHKGAVDDRVNDLLLEHAEKGFVEGVKLTLIAKADANHVGDVSKDTPLMRAVRQGHENCVDLLLEAGADVNAGYRCPPLALAAMKGGKDCVDLLLKAGADVNRAEKNGRTPIVTAAINGDKDCADLLLKAGADVNQSGKYGWTPLVAAVLNKSKDCADLLLKAGADVNQLAEGFYGRTPLEEAEMNGRMDCVDMLLKSGAGVYKSPRYGWTPLVAAAMNGGKRLYGPAPESGS